MSNDGLATKSPEDRRNVWATHAERRPVGNHIGAVQLRRIVAVDDYRKSCWMRTTASLISNNTGAAKSRRQLLRAELTRNEPGSPKLHNRHPVDRVSKAAAAQREAALIRKDREMGR